jgi:hypothetical protein
MIARSRFELLSQGPEPCMIDLYTIGLRASICWGQWYLNLSLTLLDAGGFTGDARNS